MKWKWKWNALVYFHQQITLKASNILIWVKMCHKEHYSFFLFSVMRNCSSAILKLESTRDLPTNCCQGSSRNKTFQQNQHSSRTTLIWLKRGIVKKNTLIVALQASTIWCMATRNKLEISSPNLNQIVLPPTHWKDQPNPNQDQSTTR